MTWSRKHLWETLPAPAKLMMGGILGRISLERLLGRNFRATRAFLKDAQWWSMEQNQTYQLRELRRVLGLAGSKSPFYREMFRQAGFEASGLQQLSDLRVLPTIHKVTVTDHLESMMTCPSRSLGIDYISTGGTSGMPLAFYAPAGRSAIEYAYLTTSWERAGYRLGDPMAVVRGRIVKCDSGGLRHEYDPLLRQHYYSNFHLNVENAKAYLAHIGLLGSCVLHAYPSAASSLAMGALENPELAPRNIKAVLLESENLFPDQVALVREVFGVPPFSSYGHSEKLVLATGCEHSSDYHVWPTYGYFELLDDEGHPVNTPGQRGEIVGTGFINTVLPMIRYRTGDYATYAGDSCPECGRHHTVLREIEGRWPQGNLMATDGGVISMTALNMHDDCMRMVREYQFLQDKAGEAQMLVQPIGAWSERERCRVEEMVNGRLQYQVRVKVVAVDQVHRTALGKLIRVVTSKQIEAYRTQAGVQGSDR